MLRRKCASQRWWVEHCTVPPPPPAPHSGAGASADVWANYYESGSADALGLCLGLPQIVQAPARRVLPATHPTTASDLLLVQALPLFWIPSLKPWVPLVERVCFSLDLAHSFLAGGHFGTEAGLGRVAYRAHPSHTTRHVPGRNVQVGALGFDGGRVVRSLHFPFFVCLCKLDAHDGLMFGEELVGICLLPFK